MGRSNKVLIDTNILIYMYQNKKDIFDAVILLIPNAEFFVLDKVYDEIGKVFKDKPRKKEILLRYLQKVESKEKYKIIVVPNELLQKSERYKKIDNLLIYYSKDYIIYTNDRILKEKLKQKHTKIITLKTRGAIIE